MFCWYFANEEDDDMSETERRESAMENYCVIYIADGSRYEYRCRAITKQMAKALCREKIGDDIEIVEVKIED